MVSDRTGPNMFSGFGDKAIPFLKALAFHQHRDWFQDNKAIYHAHVREPMGDLIEDVSARLAALGLPFSGHRKTSMFRVNRDVRFAKDKSPYNEHASAVLTRFGTKNEPNALYIHIKPGNCLIGAGIWQPPPDELLALRQKIIDEAGRFLGLVSDIESQGLQLDHGESLKRLPPAFSDVQDDRLHPHLKRKSHFANLAIPDDAITSPALADELVRIAQTMMPLFDFAWPAMDRAAGARDAQDA